MGFADTVFTEKTVVSAAPGQVSAELAGEAVILDLKAGTYYGLNNVGAYVWEQVQAPKSVSELADAITANYEVDNNSCRADLLTLLSQLYTADLIEVTHESGA